MELDDGTIIPSFLAVSDTSGAGSGWMHNFQDNSLRIGRIIAAYSPNSKENRNKKVVEYDVETVYANGAEGFAPIIYSNCIVASLFGGVADYFQWTPRIDNFQQSTQKGKGTKVLILCVNGNTKSAYIIGGVPHPEDTKIQKVFKNNHILNTEFNGINLSINNDGEFQFLHKGATKADGSIIDSTGTDSILSFLKDGSINLGYLDKISKEICSISLNKADKKLNLFAQSDIYSETKAKFAVKTTSGVKINEGTNNQAFLKGTIYRQEQAKLHTKLTSAITSLATAATATAAGLTTAGAATPTAAPGLTAAATAITSMVSILTQMVTAITEFEAGDYLSKIHTHAD
jgi:hypothetical protein